MKSRSATPGSVGPPLIGALLRMPWEEVRARMVEELHRRGFDDLDPSHLNVLQYPGPDGLRPSELAAKLGISKQALNYQLGELERLGYLRRAPDPRDMRSKLIQLTPRGKQAMRTMRRAVGAVERDWQRRLGKGRFAQLKQLLEDLV
jgi:DNA-binding MarR family transcriptional regulator